MGKIIFNRYFTKEDVQIANKHMKISILTIIMELSTISKSTKISKIEKTDYKCWQDVEQFGTHLHSRWECKMVPPL